MNKEFKIKVFGKEIIITQNTDGTFNKPDFIEDLKNKGTATKPAHEDWILARKKLSEKTIVENCIKHGTGALNIAGTRIPINDNYEKKHLDDIARGQENATNGRFFGGKEKSKASSIDIQSRFPADVIVSDDALNDGEITKSGFMKKGHPYGLGNGQNVYGKLSGCTQSDTHGDSGSKSRYFDLDVWAEKNGIFYCSKPSKKEKGEGNDHPTCKSLKLMSWLITLVSKEGDTVLDPFAGSGTTGIAAANLGRNYILIEKESEYVKICNQRLNAKKEKEPEQEQNSQSLCDIIFK